MGVPGSTDAEMKKTPEKLPILPEKQMKNQTKPPTGEGEARWVPRLGKPRGGATLLEDRPSTPKEQQGSCVEVSGNCNPAVRECW